MYIMLLVELAEELFKRAHIVGSVNPALWAYASSALIAGVEAVPLSNVSTRTFMRAFIIRLALHWYLAVMAFPVAIAMHLAWNWQTDHPVLQGQARGIIGLYTLSGSWVQVVYNRGGTVRAIGGVRLPQASRQLMVWVELAEESFKRAHIVGVVDPTMWAYAASSLIAGVETAPLLCMSKQFYVRSFAIRLALHWFLAELPFAIAIAIHFVYNSMDYDDEIYTRVHM